MRPTLSGQLQDYEIRRGGAAPDDREREVFFGQASAVRFLRRFRADVFALRTLRALHAAVAPGGSLARASDDQIIERLAWELAFGGLTLWRRPLARHAVTLRDSPAAELVAPPPAPAPPTPPARPAPPPPPEESDFSLDLDTAAIAQLLQDAARDGVPFCEECEKRKRAA